MAWKIKAPDKNKPPDGSLIEGSSFEVELYPEGYDPISADKFGEPSSVAPDSTYDRKGVEGYFNRKSGSKTIRIYGDGQLLKLTKKSHQLVGELKKEKEFIELFLKYFKDRGDAGYRLLHEVVFACAVNGINDKRDVSKVFRTICEAEAQEGRQLDADCAEGLIDFLEDIRKSGIEDDDDIVEAFSVLRKYAFENTVRQDLPRYMASSKKIKLDTLSAIIILNTVSMTLNESGYTHPDCGGFQQTMRELSNSFDRIAASDMLKQLDAMRIFMDTTAIMSGAGIRAPYVAMVLPELIATGSEPWVFFDAISAAAKEVKGWRRELVDMKSLEILPQLIEADVTDSAALKGWVFEYYAGMRDTLKEHWGYTDKEVSGLIRSLGEGKDDKDKDDVIRGCGEIVRGLSNLHFGEISRKELEELLSLELGDVPMASNDVLVKNFEAGTVILASKMPSTEARRELQKSLGMRKFVNFVCFLGNSSEDDALDKKTIPELVSLCKHVNDRFDLNWWSRYSLKIFEHLLSPSGNQDVLVLTVEHDHNGALIEPGDLEAFIDDGRRLIIKEVSNKWQFYNAVRSVPCDGKTELYISAHGWEDGITIDKTTGSDAWPYKYFYEPLSGLLKLDKDDADEMKFFLSKRFKRIYVTSCESGDGGSSADNIGHVIHTSSGAPVKASPKVASSDIYHNDATNDADLRFWDSSSNTYLEPVVYGGN